MHRLPRVSGDKHIAAFKRAGRRALHPCGSYYLVHKAEELGYHPQVIPIFSQKIE